MLEVGREFTRERVVEFFPDAPSPARSERPLSERIVNHDVAVRAVGDDPSGLNGTVQRRGHHRGVSWEAFGDIRGLASPGSREREAGEVGIDDVVGIADLAVSNEQDAIVRGAHLIEGTGTVEP